MATKRLTYRTYDAYIDFEGIGRNEQLASEQLCDPFSVALVVELVGVIRVLFPDEWRERWATKFKERFTEWLLLDEIHDMEVSSDAMSFWLFDVINELEELDHPFVTVTLEKNTVVVFEFDEAYRGLGSTNGTVEPAWRK